MLQTFIRQLLSVALTFWLISLISFTLIHFAPGGPLQQSLMARASTQFDAELLSPEHLTQLNLQYGFDRPILDRYISWALRLIQFDLGESYLFKQSVFVVIKNRFAVSAMYGLIALPICYLLAFLLSIRLTNKRSKAPKALIYFMLLAVYTVPPLIWALLFRFGLPALDFLGVVFLYVLTHLTVMVLLFRGALYEEQEKPYLQVAKSKGLTDFQVKLKHQLPNALIPVVTSISYSLVTFFAGSLFIETVFSIQGLGQLSFLAARSRDYNLMMGIVLLISTLFIFARAMSNAAQIYIDPRLRGWGK